MKMLTYKYDSIQTDSQERMYPVPVKILTHGTNHDDNSTKCKSKVHSNSAQEELESML